MRGVVDVAGRQRVVSLLRALSGRWRELEQTRRAAAAFNNTPAAATAGEQRAITQQAAPVSGPLSKTSSALQQVSSDLIRQVSRARERLHSIQIGHMASPREMEEAQDNGMPLLRSTTYLQNRTAFTPLHALRRALAGSGCRRVKPLVT